MSREIKSLLFDIYSEKSKVDSLFNKLTVNYQRTTEEGGNEILFWVRDREVSSLKEATEKLLNHVEHLLTLRNKILKRGH